MTTFRELHRPGTPLVMPNPWDVGSARVLATLGFAALATTSSGFAATLGKLDGQVGRDAAVAHAAELARAVPTSQGLGITSGEPGRCSSRKVVTPRILAPRAPRTGRRPTARSRR